MFQRRLARAKSKTSKSPFSALRVPAAVACEALEGRTLLHGGFGGFDDFGGPGGFGGFHDHGPGGPGGRSVLFSQLPSTIQNGLTSLASTDNVTAPAASDTV